jgi:hypothetical protein
MARALPCYDFDRPITNVASPPSCSDGSCRRRGRVQEPEGSGPPITCCYNTAAYLRYTIFTPDGAVVRHVDSVQAGADSILGVFWLGPSLRDGSHTLVLTDARLFDRLASQQSMRVVDLALLPCPAGTKRNDAATSKNESMLDGGCYPLERFAKR